MKEEIVGTNDNLLMDNIDVVNDITDDELLVENNEDDYFVDEFDTDNKNRLFGGVKLVLLLIAACIVGFMFSGIFMSFANWIIFN